MYSVGKVDGTAFYDTIRRTFSSAHEKILLNHCLVLVPTILSGNQIASFVDLRI